MQHLLCEYEFSFHIINATLDPMLGWALRFVFFVLKIKKRQRLPNVPKPRTPTPSNQASRDLVNLSLSKHIRGIIRDVRFLKIAILHATGIAD
jgi:hypothetical protein